MARGRKEGAALILEERLHAALVPGPEQPYRVPENWCWTRVGEISRVVTGNTPSRKKPKYYGGDFPFFKPGDLDAGRHVYDAAEYLTEEGKAISRTIPAQATMVCCIGSIGKCGFSEVAGATNQQINSIVPQIDPLYFYYYCNTEEFVDQLRTKASATTISIVNKSKIERCYTPIPPLSEQFRIADRIENLFGKLEALQNAGYLDRMFLSLKRTDGTEFPFDTLSEGEKQLSLLFLLLSFTAHDDCLYLFDEFDAYLHLNWQKAFAKTIHSVDINGHMIFTTHSPATVSGMHKKDVYIMSNGQAGPAPSETYNRSLDEIMEEHMLVSMRPAEYNESVQAFRGAVMRGNRAEAEAVLARIREIVGESDPFFITARIALNRME